MCVLVIEGERDRGRKFVKERGREKARERETERESFKFLTCLLSAYQRCYNCMKPVRLEEVRG